MIDEMNEESAVFGPEPSWRAIVFNYDPFDGAAGAVRRFVINILQHEAAV